MTLATATGRVDVLRALIGNTPLLEIHYRLDGRPRRLYAKYEQANMTGSVKDRMAAHVLCRAYERGELAEGDAIVEASSGNTGIALAAIGRALGHPVRIYMPDWMSRERVQLLRAFGAEVVLVSHEQGGFLGSIRAPAPRSSASSARSDGARTRSWPGSARAER
jgi:cysteine synthase A